MYKRSLNGFCVIIILIVIIAKEVSSSLPNDRNSISGCSGTRCETCSSCLTQEDENYGWCGSKPDDGFCMFGTAASPKDSCFFGWSFYICPPYEYFQVSIFNQSEYPYNPPLACFEDQDCKIDYYVPPNANLVNGTHGVFPYTNPIPFGYGIVTAVVVMETAFCINDPDDESQTVTITYSITGAPGNVQYVVTVPESGMCGPNGIAYLYPKDLPYILPNVIWWSNYSYNNNLHVLNISNIDTRQTSMGIVALSLRFLAVYVDPHIVNTTSLIYDSGESPNLPLIQLVATNYVKLDYFCVFYPNNRTGSNANIPATNSPGIIITDTLYGCTIPVFNKDVVISPKLGEPTGVYYKFGPDGIVNMEETLLRSVDLYVMPNLHSLVPPEGSMEANTEVIMVGEGFFNTVNTKLTVFLEDIAVKAVYINSTCISFVAPPKLNNISTICIYVSMDSITKTTTCLTYTYFKPPPAPNPFSPIPKGPTILTDWVFYAACSAIVLVVVIVIAIYCKTRVERKKGRNSRLHDVAIEDRTAVERAEIPPEEIQFAEVVGSGSFSIVYKGLWHGQKIAIKVIKASEPREDLLVEAAIMVKLQHPNIVKFMGACLQNPAASLFIVTEYLPRGSLSKILSNRSYKIEFEHSRKWAHDTCLGMSYLHNSNIIHRDLKPANLLVAEDWSVKVADFGLSRVLGNAQVTQTLTACGTISCSAPEVLRDQRYSLKADIYSFGVCLWAMFTRKKPYPKKTDAQIVIAVAIEGKRLPIPPKMPKEVTKLLKTCWQTDPKSRPTFQVLADTLLSISLPTPHHPYPSLSEAMDFPETITSMSSLSPLSPSSMSPSDPRENVVAITILDETAKLLD